MKLFRFTIVFGFIFYFYTPAISQEKTKNLMEQSNLPGYLFTLVSSVFQNGEPIPKKYSCDGENVSPPLEWKDPPARTKSYALICDDPDAPAGTWVHWVLFDLAPDLRNLPEGVPPGPGYADKAKQGKNDFGDPGYGGPCPPKGPAHRYFFKLYALDSDLNLKSGATKEQVKNAMKGHVLAEAQLMGRFKR